MQSSFVDIGLERDAFLYITDFMEEAGDSADFDTNGNGDSSRRRDRGDRNGSAPTIEGTCLPARSSCRLRQIATTATIAMAVAIVAEWPWSS